MRCILIDYGSGNLHSAAKSFERAAREADLAANIIVSSQAKDVATADAIVLPGVGAFGDCAQGLAAVEGMVDALETRVRKDAVPFMGICVGMQLLADEGLEHGTHKGLGWLSGQVKPLDPNDPTLKIPHMGWNTMTKHQDHPVLDGLAFGHDGWHAYFVHSYQFAVGAKADMLLSCDYGGAFTAMVGKDNMIGTQFHPEKSQRLGLKLITNFLKWRV